MPRGNSRRKPNGVSHSMAESQSPEKSQIPASQRDVIQEDTTTIITEGAQASTDGVTRQEAEASTAPPHNETETQVSTAFCEGIPTGPWKSDEQATAEINAWACGIGFSVCRARVARRQSEGAKLCTLDLHCEHGGSADKLGRVGRRPSKKSNCQWRLKVHRPQGETEWILRPTDMPKFDHNHSMEPNKRDPRLPLLREAIPAAGRSRDANIPMPRGLWNSSEEAILALRTWAARQGFAIVRTRHERRSSEGNKISIITLRCSCWGDPHKLKLTTKGTKKTGCKWKTRIWRAKGTDGWVIKADDVPSHGHNHQLGILKTRSKEEVVREIEDTAAISSRGKSGIYDELMKKFKLIAKHATEDEQYRQRVMTVMEVLHDSHRVDT